MSWWFLRTLLSGCPGVRVLCEHSWILGVLLIAQGRLPSSAWTWDRRSLQAPALPDASPCSPRPTGVGRLWMEPLQAACFLTGKTKAANLTRVGRDGVEDTCKKSSCGEDAQAPAAGEKAEALREALDVAEPGLKVRPSAFSRGHLLTSQLELPSSARPLVAPSRILCPFPTACPHLQLPN